MPADSDPPAPSGVALFVALGVGLIAVLVAAWATSVYGTDEATNWIITGAAGLAAALATYLFMKRRSSDAGVERHPGEH